MIYEASLIHTSFFIKQLGFAIKCWVCRSDEDPKCADPFDNSTLPIVDCKERKLSHLFGTSLCCLLKALPQFS